MGQWKEGRKETNGRANMKDEFWLFHSHIRQFLLVIFPQKPDKQKPVVVFIVHPMYFCLVLFSSVVEIFHLPRNPQVFTELLQGCGAPSNISPVYSGAIHVPCVLSQISLADCDSIPLTSYASTMRMIHTSNTLCLFMITLKTNYSCCDSPCLPYETRSPWGWGLVHCVHLWVLRPWEGAFYTVETQYLLNGFFLLANRLADPNGRETRRTGNHWSSPF